MLLGAGISGFALSKSVPLSGAVLVLVGASMMAVFATVNSLVQLITTNEMRGRVMSVYNFAFRGGMPMGNLLSGWLVPVFTAPVVLGVNGILLVLLALYFLLCNAGWPRCEQPFATSWSKNVVRPERFELPTYCSGGNRSIHLSYGRPLQFTWGLRSINVSIAQALRSSNRGPRIARESQAHLAGARISLNCVERVSERAVSSGRRPPPPPPRPPRSPPRSPPRPPRSRPPPPACSVLGTGLVYVERASAHLRTVQRRDGFFSIFVAGHFHKAEPARASGVAVGHDADPVHLPERLKHLPQFVFRCAKAQIPHENILHASASALSCRSASSMRRTGRSGTPS